MDIIQEFVKQKLGDVKPRYSRTFQIQAGIIGATNVINQNFVNEKVLLIICTHIWISYNSFDSPVQIIDIYNQNVFETPVPPATDTQISGMFPFNYVTDSGVLSFSANNTNFKFTIFFVKVFSFNNEA